MMLNFPGFSKIKTKQMVFEEVFLASDSGTLEELKELSSKRRAIEESINGRSSTAEAIAREMSGGLTSRCEQDIQKLEQYLPLLKNLMHHVNLCNNNPRVIRWTSDLKIRWSSALSSSCFFQLTSSKYFQIDTLHFELAMALFLYGALLREHALEVLQTDLVQSATHLRKAAGVYQHLAKEVLPHLQLIQAPEKPPESAVCVSSALSLVCLAEAQAVTARKAEENGNYTQNVLAKLHYGVTDFLDEALGVLHSNTKGCKDISSRFTNFITSCRTLHELKSYKYLAENLAIDKEVVGAESRTSDKTFGDAVGVLRRAVSNAEKNMPKEESWRLVFKQLIQESSRLLKKYEHENDFIWQQKIPGQHELPSPEAVKIVSSVPYQPQMSKTTLVFNV